MALAQIKERKKKMGKKNVAKEDLSHKAAGFFKFTKICKKIK